MAKQVIWSFRAQSDRKEILDYWRQRNKSTSYCKKLNQLFKESIKIIADFPKIGRSTNDFNIRVKIVKDYLIIYEETATQILILTIWDGRQDPEKLHKILK
ncbi:type II toxin-antitoxin system RelE/ParE family toxin [Solitalea agri]|uniref:type II toxin-antitoxin system RelE/ParE family toxin n=1 Tax=Solitalea TaxID=929509 RepID=UPI003618391A